MSDEYELLKSVRLLHPVRGGPFILKMQRENGSVERYQVSLSDVHGVIRDGADMAFRYREEMW